MNPTTVPSRFTLNPVLMTIALTTFVCTSCRQPQSPNPDSTVTERQGKATRVEKVREPDDPERDDAAKTDFWPVRQQLIRGKPWGSENESEQDLLTNVKEAEASPSERLVFALNDLAGWYRGKKRNDDAVKIYKRVQELQLKRTGNPNHLDNAFPLNDMGVVYTDALKFDDAEKAFKACIAIHEKDSDAANNDGEAESRHNYAELLWGMRRNKDAEKQNEISYSLLREREKAIETK